MPRFSIIIPVFNAADTLAKTLLSLQTQTQTDWEAICIDDGSSDASTEVLSAFAAIDPRIRIATHSNRGPSETRNRGVYEFTTGEIVTFCDADDIWADTKLARLSRHFDAGAEAVFGKVGFFRQTPKDAARWSTVPKTPLSIQMLLAENPVCTVSNLSLRRDTFQALGGFDASLVHNEDLEFLVRLVGSGAKIVGDPAPHLFYRANPNGLSADLEKMRAGREATLRTAARFGVSPDDAAEAVYARYLARRALRLDSGAHIALRYAIAGLAHDPRAFLFPLRRGALTALAACIAPVLPRRLRLGLFAA